MFVVNQLVDMDRGLTTCGGGSTKMAQNGEHNFIQSPTYTSTYLC